MSEILSQDLLIEIGTEELPPKHSASYAEAFQRAFSNLLTEHQLHCEHLTHYVAPRRLAIYVEKLISKQPDYLVEKMGPPITAAFDTQEKPTPAAEGFARRCGVPLSAISQKVTDKGTCLYFQKSVTGALTTLLLPELIEKSLQQIPIQKPMRWGTHKQPFIRPVHWILALYGEHVMPVQLFDQQADRYTQGHRFHAPDKIIIQKPADYLKRLENAFVLIDHRERQRQIEEKIATVATVVNGTPVFDQALIEEVTGLVEWPTALLASFSPQFLSLPKEVLIACITQHQKSFPIENAEGEILPYFVVVTHLQSQEPQKIIHGNERVMRARLSDAAFFYEIDQKIPLIDRLLELERVVYQEKLGSLYEKARRLSVLAEVIASQWSLDTQIAHRAALLAKCDLTTQMVGEFPELQGTIGGYYAKASGESDTLAKAIQQHYRPRFATDRIPDEPLNAVIAIIDKVDTLIGIFSVGGKPTGEKDPFGLRRAALGIIRILIEGKYPLNLNTLLKKSVSLFPKANAEIAVQVRQFIQERAAYWYESDTHTKDEWLAASAINGDNTFCLFDIFQRALAIQTFRRLPENETLIAANKRVKNILSKFVGTVPDQVDAKLLVHTAEQQLFEVMLTVQRQLSSLINATDYLAALKTLTTLREPIDHFFEQVMVMTDDRATQQNRLALLNQLRGLFLQVGDIGMLNG